MPIKVGWLVEPQVVVMEVSGVLSLAEYRAGSALSYEMMEQSEKAYVLSDQTQLIKQPSVTEMAQVQSHSSMEMLIEIGSPNPAVQFGSSVTMHALGLEHRAERTMKDALKYLSQREPMLARALQDAEPQWLATFDDRADPQPQ